MRIAQVVQGLPPQSLGGTETYALYLSKELRRLGHEVSLFYRTVSPQKEAYAVERSFLEGLPAVSVNNPFRPQAFSQSYQNPHIARHFGAFLDTFAPHVVHFHHLMYLSTTCIEEAARRRIPIVMTLHDFWLICQRGRFLKPDLSLCAAPSLEGCARCFAHLLNRKLLPWYQKWKPALERRSWFKERLRRLHSRYGALYRPSKEALAQIQERMDHVRAICGLVSLFLTPSRFLREKFLEFGIPEEKLVYAECGLPTQEIQIPEKRKTSPPLVFAYIGVLDPVKGVHLLVEAFQKIHGAELRLYGGEADYAVYPNRRRFLSQIRRSPHIRLMGRYEHREVGRILSEVDVVVVPSIWYENAPLVIREAFLARRPVITADLGGMREWVQDGVSGFLFKPRSVEDLRDKILRFLAHPHLVEDFSRNIPPVKSISEDAQEMEARYRALMRQGVLSS